VEYISSEPTLVGDSDVPLMPVNQHYIIAVLATVFLLERTTKHVGRGAMAQFSIYRNEYEKWVARQKAVQVRSNGGPSVPRVRPGAAW
jgi:hypothetical protein